LNTIKSKGETNQKTQQTNKKKKRETRPPNKVNNYHKSSLHTTSLLTYYNLPLKILINSGNIKNKASYACEDSVNTKLPRALYVSLTLARGRPPCTFHWNQSRRPGKDRIRSINKIRSTTMSTFYHTPRITLTSGKT
jgi:hypothetical protein